jgi:L-rhamnose mutarotase
MPRRVCYALDLVDDADLIEAYERAHAPGATWPAVAEGIRQKGFLDMEIWRADDRLFMVATVADDWPRPLSTELLAVENRWESEMDSFQRPLPRAEAGEKWRPMRRIFSLAEQ